MFFLADRSARKCICRFGLGAVLRDAGESRGCFFVSVLFCGARRALDDLILFFFLFFLADRSARKICFSSKHSKEKMKFRLDCRIEKVTACVRVREIHFFSRQRTDWSRKDL